MGFESFGGEVVPSIENRWGRAGTESIDSMEKELATLMEIQERLPGALDRLNSATNADVDAEINNPLRKDDTSLERNLASGRYNELLSEARSALRLPEGAQVSEDILARYIEALKVELGK